MRSSIFLHQFFIVTISVCISLNYGLLFYRGCRSKNVEDVPVLFLRRIQRGQTLETLSLCFQHFQSSSRAKENLTRRGKVKNASTTTKSRTVQCTHKWNCYSVTRNLSRHMFWLPIPIPKTVKSNKNQVDMSFLMSISKGTFSNQFQRHISIGNHFHLPCLTFVLVMLNPSDFVGRQHVLRKFQKRFLT